MLPRPGPELRCRPVELVFYGRPGVVITAPHSVRETGFSLRAATHAGAVSVVRIDDALPEVEPLLCILLDRSYVWRLGLDDTGSRLLSGSLRPARAVPARGVPASAAKHRARTSGSSRSTNGVERERRVARAVAEGGDRAARRAHGFVG